MSHVDDEIHRLDPSSHKEVSLLFLFIPREIQYKYLKVFPMINVSFGDLIVVVHALDASGRSLSVDVSY